MMSFAKAWAALLLSAVTIGLLTRSCRQLRRRLDRLSAVLLTPETPELMESRKRAEDAERLFNEDIETILTFNGVRKGN